MGATNFLELGVVFKRVNNNVKYFVPITTMHHLTRRQLEVTLTSMQRSKHTTDEVKFEITRRITWLGEVRKFWLMLIKFLKLNK